MKNSNLSRVLSIAEISYVISNENLPTFYGVLRYCLMLEYSSLICVSILMEFVSEASLICLKQFWFDLFIGIHEITLVLMFRFLSLLKCKL